MELSDRIRLRRKELGLTQEELAKRMGKSGKTYVSKIENGYDNLTTTTLKMFAIALNVTPQWLLGIEQTDSKLIDSVKENFLTAKADIELLEMFHSLNESEQLIILNTIKALLAK